MKQFLDARKYSVRVVACSTGFVDRGVWLRVAKQFLSCALVRGRGVVSSLLQEYCEVCWERLS